MSKSAQDETRLTGVALQDTLWDTLKRVRDGEITPATADAVAVQARRITRTMKTRLQVLKAANQTVVDDLVDFAKS